jgi:hypothetical protein
VQFGWQGATQVPFSQVLPGAQLPHEPLQPSEPQFLPAQAGWQVTTQAPASQVLPGSQLPHVPPQPSSPQALPLQSGWQVGPQEEQEVHKPAQISSQAVQQ